MTTHRDTKQRKLPFWKRWLLWILFVVTGLLTLVFVALTMTMPFLYRVELDSQGVMVYAMGMSLVLAIVCADSARRIYRKLKAQ